MNNITVQSLKQRGHQDAEVVFAKIASIGGFGDVAANQGGGLLLDGLSESKLNRIMEIVENPEPKESGEGEEGAKAPAKTKGK
jgi:hypothetical protein